MFTRMVRSVVERIGSVPRVARFARVAIWAAATAGVASLAGCNDPYNAVQPRLESMFAAGDYAGAAALLDDPKNQQAFGQKSRLVYLLDRGSIALARGNLDLGLTNLGEAEEFMETRRTPTAGDEISQWLVNDSAATYYGEPYEEVYVNVLKLAARLELGQIDGGATVEARRAAGKADVLRERYLRTVRAVNHAGEQRAPGFSPPPLGPQYQSTGGEFIESPLGLFLSAVTFMKSGSPDLQDVAARRLGTAIQAQGGLVGPVNAESFAGLGRERPEDVNTLFVAFSGRGPTMHAERFGPIPIYTYTVYFELPVLDGGSAEADGARVVFEDGAAPPLDLALAEDMRSVAEANHRRQLPLIYARAFLRSTLKATGVAVGTEALRRGTSGQESTQAAVEIAGIIGGLLWVTQSEKADLRCWTFLPGQAHVGLAKLSPGEHRVHIEYLRSGGVLYATPPQTVTVGDGRNDLTTVVGHYWK